MKHLLLIFLLLFDVVLAIIILNMVTELLSAKNSVENAVGLLSFGLFPVLVWVNYKLLKGRFTL